MRKLGRLLFRCFIIALAAIPFLLLIHRFTVHTRWPVGDDIWWVQMGLQDYIHLKNNFFSYFKEILSDNVNQWGMKGSLHSIIMSMLLIFTGGQVGPLAAIFSLSSFITAWYIVHEIFKRLELSKELRVIATSYVISTPIAFTCFWGTTLEATVMLAFLTFIHASLTPSYPRLNFAIAIAFMTRPILFTTSMASLLIFNFKERKLAHISVYIFILIHSSLVAGMLHLVFMGKIGPFLAIPTLLLILGIPVLFYFRFFPSILPRKSFVFLHISIAAFLLLMGWRIYHWLVIAGGTDIMSDVSSGELLLHMWPAFYASLYWELFALIVGLGILFFQKRMSRALWRRTVFFLSPLLLTLIFVLLKKLPDFRYWIIPFLMVCIYAIHLIDLIISKKLPKKVFALFIALLMVWNCLLYSRLAYMRFSPQVLQFSWIDKSLKIFGIAWAHGWIPARIIMAPSPHENFINEIIKKYPQDSRTVFYIRTLLPQDGELAYNEIEFFQTLYQEKEKKYRHEQLYPPGSTESVARSCPKDLDCVYIGGPYVRIEDMEEKKSGVDQLLETVSFIELRDELSETGRIFFVTGPLKRFQ